MRLTGTFVLSEQAVLQPVLELGEEFCRRSGAESGDFALSRRNSRSYSKVVDPEAAELIRGFATPTTVALAVARYCRDHGGDPEQTLDEALPLIRALFAEGVLEAEGHSQRLQGFAPLVRGARVDGWVVTRCIQSLQDTEVYQVRDAEGRWGAMKIGHGRDDAARRSLAREANLLDTVTVESLPRLLAADLDGERPYLVTAWIAGIDVQSAADEIRVGGLLHPRHALHSLGAKILDAYADLHQHSLVHGDIHPGNMLVDRDQRITLIDFGHAVRPGETSHGRAGVSFFFEPEFALAAVQRVAPPAATPVGEQYSLAALLYLLLTGFHTQDFPLERQAMLAGLAEGGMTPFAQRGLAPWPEIESLLARALDADPRNRFASTRLVAEAWREAAPSFDGTERKLERHPKLIAMLREVSQKSVIGGEWWREIRQVAPEAQAPLAAVNSGGAGLAFALYRLASATGDGELFAAADAWITRSVRQMEAASPPSPRPAAETPGLASLHHQRAGCYVAEALIAAARGDLRTQCRAVESFVGWGTEARKEPGARLDLTLGFAGGLLGAAFLMDSFDDAISPAATEVKAALRRFADDLSDHLWMTLGGLSPVDGSLKESSGKSAELANLAVAHGWAGILYASLCWCMASGRAIPDLLRLRLDQLAARAEPIGRGLHWPWGGTPPIPSWCNGSAGMVFVWTQAFEALGDPRYFALAESAAWNTWEMPARMPSLCCGLAGQAYALLNFFRHSGDAVWLRRAMKMAEWAAGAAISPAGPSEESPEIHPLSLYNGAAGIAALAADLERPREARMPLFERE